MFVAEFLAVGKRSAFRSLPRAALRSALGCKNEAAAGGASAVVRSAQIDPLFGGSAIDPRFSLVGEVPRLIPAGPVWWGSAQIGSSLVGEVPRLIPAGWGKCPD